MSRIFLITLLVVIAAAMPIAAQESTPTAQPETATQVEQAQPTAGTVAVSFGTGIDRETRTLSGAADRFTADVGQVFCFTHLKGIDAPAVVTHAWYHEGNTMARVDLNVGAADWRTWSSKLVLPGWTGHWEVKVLDAAGKVLGSASFELQ